MSLKAHAINELDIIGLTEDDEMNGEMRKHILHMIDEFSKEGHSGFSASYAVSILAKLLKYEPLTPLTGEDSEWMEIAKEMTDPNQGTLYQNKRASHVFKDDSGAYDINGKVFVEHWRDKETDEMCSSSYTSMESRVPVTFPYVPTVQYIDVGRVADI
jgi:hypothetical protein